MTSGSHGFTRPDLFRIHPFCEVRRPDAIVSSVARQFPGTHQLILLGNSKRPEGCDFRLRIKPGKVSAVPTQMQALAGQDKA